MRFSVVLLAALSAAASARSLGSLFGDDQSALVDDKEKVPGSSPLMFCNKDRSGDIVIIENVDLTPNPPKAGVSLLIEASGTVNERIEPGAYANIVVSYGYIRLISTTVDLCEQVGNVDLECPIEAGKLTIIKEVELPKEIPPGKYKVIADVFTAGEKKHITCLEALVEFKRDAASEL